MLFDLHWISIEFIRTSLQIDRSFPIDHKRHIHQLWNQILTQTPILTARIIVGTRNNQNMTQKLVQRKTVLLHNANELKFLRETRNSCYPTTYFNAHFSIGL